MNIASMTGFGRGEATVGGIAATVEISSVNRRQLDCAVSLPSFLNSLETRVQTLLRRYFSRGSIRAAITIARDHAAGAADSTEHWRAQIASLRAAAAALALPDDLSASSLLGLAGPETRDTPPEAAWAAIAAALEIAMGELAAMRRREGAAIGHDLRQRLANLQTIRDAIGMLAPEVPRAYRDTLHTRLRNLLEGGPTMPDRDALAREVAIFADRCDISEELTRLESHFAQAAAMLNGNEPCGRALDFLCQEFLREINTIGSKANNAEITRLVIAFKTDLEAFREQVQNLE